MECLRNGIYFRYLDVRFFFDTGFTDDTDCPSEIRSAVTASISLGRHGCFSESINLGTRLFECGLYLFIIIDLLKLLDNLLK